MNNNLKDNDVQSTEIKFYKSTFEKISEDRRQKILDVAIAEFAANGYNGTNINVITKKAGISTGAMYSYFASKEDLFLTIVDLGYKLLEDAIKEIDVDGMDVFAAYERLLHITRDYAQQYPQMNQIYLDSTTQGLKNLSSRLSNKMESITAKYYMKALKKAKENQLISKDTDERLASFCMDNLIVMFQFSFTSEYYKERLRIFLGENALEDEEKIIQGIMQFVRKALA
ncbi:MAG: TetR/AcrR family transcriptional regulator [Bacillota bacterium]